MPSPRPPSGLSIRQERFCHAYLRTGVAASAAVEAGYAVLSCVNQGYRLLQRADVQARIAEIQAELARAACNGTDVLLGKLETVYRQAVADRHYTAAARAVDLQSRILRQDRLDRLRLAEIEKAVSDGSDGAGEADGRIAESHPMLGSPTSPSRCAGPSLSAPGGGEGRGEVGVDGQSDDPSSHPDCEGATLRSDDLGFPSDQDGGRNESDDLLPSPSSVGEGRDGGNPAGTPRRNPPPGRPREGGRTGPVVRHTRLGIRAPSARDFRGADASRHGPVPD